MVVIDTFADNMRELRMRAGLSQEMLAEKSGLHRTYIGSIEQRRANISLKNVEKIADASTGSRRAGRSSMCTPTSWTR